MPRRGGARSSRGRFRGTLAPSIARAKATRRRRPARELGVPRRTYREHSESAGWDALRYALQVLRVLGIANTSIALFYGTRGVSVDSGRDWGRGPGQRWATVSVAPWAKREEVAAALMALAGRADEPLLLQSLLALEKAS
jgi:hypothetical protein